MKRVAVVTIICLMLTGCSMLPFRGFTTPAADNYRDKLASASSALAKGENREAAAILWDICAHSSVAGVTDEAIARLALLRLSAEENSTGRKDSRLLLARLKREFPHSQWTTLTRPLVELMDEMEGLEGENERLTSSARTRELQNIKGLNQSLIRQNRDLQQTIDRLKAMDLELERKTR